ncbi:MAG: hypothetical protein JJ913_09615 [Rhizobiaceae bacterium]|nr:hypothetical protein [Rhizobiaceae bacterium]
MNSTRPADTDTIASGTARSWDEWLEFLTGIGAEKLSHTEIARKVKATGDANGWWSQAITVAFEQHIGRRDPGQRADGSYEVSVTRSLPGERDDIYTQVCGLLDAMPDFDGIAGESRTSVTPKRSYWRASLEDGTAIVLSVEDKGDGKVLVALAHQKLADADEIARWRAFWKDVLAKL